MVDVDYISAAKAKIPAQKSDPFEIGLGWAVNFEKGAFIGRKALLAGQGRLVFQQNGRLVRLGVPQEPFDEVAAPQDPRVPR